MLLANNYYMSVKGRLVKIISAFKYADGAEFNAAVFFPGNGWFPTRLKANGQSIESIEHSVNEADTFEAFLLYCITNIFFDRAARTWGGTMKDMSGHLIVSITGIETSEQTLKLLQLGTQEKLLTWMKDTGYVDEMDEGAM